MNNSRELIIPKFKPKKNIEDYLHWSFLQHYEDLTEEGEWFELFEPLLFFNLLTEKMELVKLNYNRPLG